MDPTETTAAYLATGLAENGSFRSLSDGDVDFKNLEDFLHGEQGSESFFGDGQSSSSASLGLSGLSSSLSGESSGLQQVVSAISMSSDPHLKQQLLSALQAHNTHQTAVPATATGGTTQVYASQLAALGMSHQTNRTPAPTTATYAMRTDNLQQGGLPSPPDSSSDPYSPQSQASDLHRQALQRSAHLSPHSVNSPTMYMQNSPGSDMTTSTSSPHHHHHHHHVTDDMLTAGQIGRDQQLETQQQLAVLQQQQQSLDQLQRNLMEQSQMIAQLSKTGGHQQPKSRSVQQATALQALLQQQQKQLQMQQATQMELLKAMQQSVKEQEEKQLQQQLHALQQEQLQKQRQLAQQEQQKQLAKMAAAQPQDSPPPLASVLPAAKKRKYSTGTRGKKDMPTVEANPSVDEDSDSPNDVPQGISLDATYQCLKWQAHNPDTWHRLVSANCQELTPPVFQVEADKGFNFSPIDDSFVCQKKNHFQITTIISLPQEAYYISTKTGLIKLERLSLHAHGIKLESPMSSNIVIEQSQVDRKKRPFSEVMIDLTTDLSTKVTIGRLHFSETTANNMRKKGRPNPDQRYFSLVVTLNAYGSDGNPYLILAQVSERIIVRASNPGQFENEMDMAWSRSQQVDSIYHTGRVGINTERPDEALSVHGNIRLTGQLLKQSDQRVKEAIEEVDPKETLQHIQKLHLYRYQYKPDYALAAGIDPNDRNEMGIIAQEVQEVIPDAVRETEDVNLPDGEKLEKLLVVNRDRIYMESVGAVKELCRVTDNLETRINELELLKRRRHQQCHRHLPNNSSVRSNSSYLSCKTGSQASLDSRSTSTIDVGYLSHYAHYPPSYQPDKKRKHIAEVKMVGESSVCTPKFMQRLIIVLILVMTASIVAMAALYLLRNNDSSTTAPGDTSISGTIVSATTLPANTSTFSNNFSTTGLVTATPTGTAQASSSTSLSTTVEFYVNNLPRVLTSSAPSAVLQQCCYAHGWASPQNVTMAMPTTMPQATTIPTTTALPTTTASPTTPTSTAEVNSAMMTAAESSTKTQTGEPGSSATNAAGTRMPDVMTTNRVTSPVTSEATAPTVKTPLPPVANGASHGIIPFLSGPGQWSQLVYPDNSNTSRYHVNVPPTSDYDYININFNSTMFNTTAIICEKIDSPTYKCYENDSTVTIETEHLNLSSTSNSHTFRVPLWLSLEIQYSFRVFLPNKTASCDSQDTSSFFPYTLYFLHSCS